MIINEIMNLVNSLSFPTFSTTSSTRTTASMNKGEAASRLSFRPCLPSSPKYSVFSTLQKFKVTDRHGGKLLHGGGGEGMRRVNYLRDQFFARVRVDHRQMFPS